MDPARILIVEDEQIVAKDIRESLKESGFEVCQVVASGEEAIESVEKHRPDAILMDITLAGEIDGIEAATRIAEKSDVPVVYLTAHSDEATLQRAKITQPYGYVLKPFEDIELRIALEIALYRSQHQPAIGSEPERVEKEAEALTRGQGIEGMSGSAVEQDIQGVIEFLRQIPPFSLVPEAQLSSFAVECRTRSYAQGDIISTEGELGEYSKFIVVSGRVAMVKTSRSGRELIVELLPPGDAFGLLIGVETQPYPLTARAQLASEVLRVSRSAFLGLLSDVPELYRTFMQEINARLLRAHSVSRALAHDRVEVRIASALSTLASRLFSVQGSEDVPKIAMTRQELADLTGTTVETAIRTTRALERSGILDLSTVGVIRIRQPEELLKLADI